VQLNPSQFFVCQLKVQPRYSGGIGVSGNETPLFIINPVSSANSSFAWGAGGGHQSQCPRLLTGDV
jgi:hypothetical protein